MKLDEIGNSEMPIRKHGSSKRCQDLSAHAHVIGALKNAQTDPWANLLGSAKALKPNLKLYFSEDMFAKVWCSQSCLTSTSPNIDLSFEFLPHPS